MTRQGQLDVRQDGLHLVEIEVLQLVGRRENDAVAAQPVRAVEQVAGVELEQPPQERHLLVGVAVGSRTDLDRGGHHRPVGAQGHDGLHVPLRDQEEGAVVTPLEGAAGGHQIGFQILDRSRHEGASLHRPSA